MARRSSVWRCLRSSVQRGGVLPADLAEQRRAPEEERDRRAGRCRLSYETEMLEYGFAAVAESLHHPFSRPPASLWDQFIAVHTVGDVVEVTVTGHLPMGAFAEITARVGGILIGARPAPGSRVTARIREIDQPDRRMSLVLP
jgi:hypothetical protein